MPGARSSIPGHAGKQRTPRLAALSLQPEPRDEGLLARLPSHEGLLARRLLGWSSGAPGAMDTELTDVHRMLVQAFMMHKCATSPPPPRGPIRRATLPLR